MPSWRLLLPRPQKTGKVPQGLLLNNAASYVTRILSVMGLVEPAADR